MELVVAQSTHTGLASRTTAILAALKFVHVGRLNPLAAASGGTIQTVLCRVFLISLIPEHLELVVKQVVDVLERDVIGTTAFGRHVLRILDGHVEDAA